LSPEQRRAEIPELQAELSPEFEARTKGAIKRHIARLNSRRRLWQPRNTASPTSSPRRWTAPLNGCVVSSRNALTGSAAYKIDPAKDARLAWRTFLRNHAPDIAAMDLFVAPTIGFDLLYLLVIVRLERRKLVWINVTPHPTAEWIARQVTEAFPWDEAPRYLIRDRCLHRPITGHGHPRQANCPWLALAERLRRKTDRIDPTRVCRPYCRPKRSAHAPNPDEICRLL
jgi:hypothetical protein